MAQVHVATELRRLLGELPHEVLGQHLREAGHVEDVLLGIERRELSAQLRQRVDDPRRGAAHPRVELREDPRRPAADDREVLEVVGLHGRETWRGAILYGMGAW